MSNRNLSDRRTVAFPTALLALLLPTCATHHENRDCTGETFPSVTGEALDGTIRNLPADLVGKPAVVLIGYEQRAQFDADRWLFGMLQSGTPVNLLELPTIPGIFPRLASGMIDGGMRSGIPIEEWQTVVTLYGADARAIAAFTGTEGGRNIRALLLDQQGTVVWLHDRGFSAGKMLELDGLARALLAVKD
ncbi:MAG: hypothetical protein EXS13_15270 [Planctomycetes bacterium]|nr:hypothetical protein [Planctomycetota bacterium]